jgi:hypothetical protein
MFQLANISTIEKKLIILYSEIPLFTKICNNKKCLLNGEGSHRIV